MKRIYTDIFIIITAAVTVALPDPTGYCNESLLVRSYSGIGIRTEFNSMEMAGGYHRDGRFLLNANNNQRYGLDISYINCNEISDNSGNICYIGVDFILRQKLTNWLFIAIGTVGYIGVGENSNTPFLILTNSGWEPDLESYWSPFVTYRAECIFDQGNYYQISSISCGIISIYYNEIAGA